MFWAVLPAAVGACTDSAGTSKSSDSSDARQMANFWRPPFHGVGSSFGVSVRPFNAEAERNRHSVEGTLVKRDEEIDRSLIDTSPKRGSTLDGWCQFWK